MKRNATRLMPYRLRTLLIVLALLAAVIVFGTAMAAAHRLALEDALLERLDRPTVAVVMDYVDDTWASRSLAYALMAGVWVAAGIAIERPTLRSGPAIDNRP
jgi:hypothetical protein